jgi:hypothetical protein
MIYFLSNMVTGVSDVTLQLVAHYSFLFLYIYIYIERKNRRGDK